MPPPGPGPAAPRLSSAAAAGCPAMPPPSHRAPRRRRRCAPFGGRAGATALPRAAARAQRRSSAMFAGARSPPGGRRVAVTSRVFLHGPHRPRRTIGGRPPRHRPAAGTSAAGRALGAAGAPARPRAAARDAGARRRHRPQVRSAAPLGFAVRPAGRCLGTSGDFPPSRTSSPTGEHLRARGDGESSESRPSEGTGELGEPQR